MALAPTLVDGAGAGLRGLVDMLMPPTCMACKAPVAVPLGLCADCWAALPTITGARCNSCGIPLPLAYQTESACLGCLNEPPDFDGALSPFLYDGPARLMVLALKNGRESYAAPMAAAMLRAANGMAAPGRIIVPVPLHRWRILSRGYNQAALLARAVARLSGGILALDLLRRTRPTPRSQGMNRSQRQRNVKGAFRIAPGAGNSLKGRHVLLVDDVMTSGATASACARALRRGGAASVHVLTYARVAATDGATYLSANCGQDVHGEG